MMNNREFEEYFQNRLFDHIEPLDADGWDTFSDALLAAQRARTHRKVALRRALYSTSAVAAAVLLFLLLFPPQTTPPYDGTGTSPISLLDPTHLLPSPVDALGSHLLPRPVDAFSARNADGLKVADETMHPGVPYLTLSPEKAAALSSVEAALLSAEKSALLSAEKSALLSAEKSAALASDKGALLSSDKSATLTADEAALLAANQAALLAANEVSALVVDKELVDVPARDSLEKQDFFNQLNIRYVKDFESDMLYKKRNYGSDGWLIALASAYSNAAGEAPFSPSVKMMTGRTRIFATSVGEFDYQEYTALSFAPPVSLGLNFQKELLPWLSIGVGVNYTLLQSKYSNSYSYMGEEFVIRQSLHYVGLPVAALFHFVNQPKLKVYASAGGMVEKAVTAYSTTTSKYSRNSKSEYVKGLQWSVQAGLGMEVMMTRTVGIYLEPGMGYFFDCDQPRSIRTLQPAQLKAEVGLRVRI